MASLSAAEVPPEPAAPVVPVVPDTPVAPTPEQTEEAEITTLEQELTTATPALAKGHIPTSRHQAVVTRQRKQFETQMAELRTKTERFEAPAVQERLKAMELFETSPEAAIQFVLEQPEYAPIVERMIAERAATVAPKPAVVEDAPLPEPDGLMADGRAAYSADTLTQVAEILARKIAREENKALLTRLDSLEQGVKPMRDEREASARRDADLQRFSGVLAEARASWDGFKEHEDEIRAEFNKAPRAGIERAYAKVVTAKSKVDRASIETELRAKLLKDASTGATPPARPGPGTPAATPHTGDDDVDPITAAIQRAASGLK